MAKKETDSASNSMSILNEHIKNNTFNSLYLLYGNEAYLLNQYKDNLVNALISPSDTMNLSVYKSDGCNVSDIISDASTLPFFSDKRVVLVENSGFFKNSNDELAESLSDIPESTCLIFCEKEIDKRGKPYKTAKKYGCVLNFDTPDERTLAIWLKNIFRDENFKIEDAAIFKLLEVSTPDMSCLYNEATKLKDYCFEKKIVTVADIDAICTSQIQNKIFDMTEAISNHDKNLSIKLYNDLLELREPAMRILYLINRHYTILSQIKLMTTENYNTSHMAASLKIPEFAVKKYKMQCKNYEYKDLLKKVDMCQNADLAIKTGRSYDKTAVEMLIINLIY